MIKLQFITALAAAGLAAGLGGCTSNNQLDAPRANLAAAVAASTSQAAQLERKMTDQDIADLLDLDVKAKLPTSLAVAKLESRSPALPPTMATPGTHELEGWRRIAAKYPDAIEGVHPVSGLAVSYGQGRQGPTLRDLREAAARMHCELLLVYVQGDSSVENYNNSAALYWTGVGLWLASGTDLEHATAMQAALIDCRTGAILGTVWADSQQKAVCAAAYKGITESRLAAASQGETMGELQQAFGPLLEAVIVKARE